MGGSNIQHYFEKLDRALKRLGIVLVDDFEEVKKGVAAPIVALVRKLLFNTSTIVMKYMLLRGCPSHVGDKKVVISLFDLLRETVKYSPPISIDQFFVTGFGQHKIVILTKLAEYVAHIDRMAGRSGNKTAFVVHNEVLQAAQNSSNDNTAAVHASLLDTNNNNNSNNNISDSVNNETAENKAVSNSTNATPRAVSRSSTRPFTSPDNNTSSLPLTPPSSTTLGQRRSLSSQRAVSRVSSAQTTPLAAPPIASHFKATLDLPETLSAEHHSDVLNEKVRHLESQVKALQESVSRDYVLKSDVEQLVEEKMKVKLTQTVSEISEKYDFVINKLVAAVDAEFTLLNNRLKLLETTLNLPGTAINDTSVADTNQANHNNNNNNNNSGESSDNAANI